MRFKSFIYRALPATAFVALAGCWDEGLYDYDEAFAGGGSSYGANYTIKPETYQCNAACTLSNPGAETQVASLCDGARAAYDLYYDNAQAFNIGAVNGQLCEGSVCINSGTLEQLYSQYQVHADQAREFNAVVAC